MGLQYTNKQRKEIIKLHIEGGYSTRLLSNEYYLENEPRVYFARATSCINESHYVHQWEPPSNLMTPIDDVAG